MEIGRGNRSTNKIAIPEASWNMRGLFFREVASLTHHVTSTLLQTNRKQIKWLVAGLKSRRHRSRGICGGQSGTAAGFGLPFQFSILSRSACAPQICRTEYSHERCHHSETSGTQDVLRMRPPPPSVLIRAVYEEEWLKCQTICYFQTAKEPAAPLGHLGGREEGRGVSGPAQPLVSGSAQPLASGSAFPTAGSRACRCRWRLQHPLP
jgi:hypothetical protein